MAAVRIGGSAMVTSWEEAVRIPGSTAALVVASLLATWPAAAGEADGLCSLAQRECLDACPVHFCVEACLTRSCLDGVEIYFDCARDAGCIHGDDACAARACPDTCMEMADEASCLAWETGEPGFGALVLQRFADQNEPPPPPAPPAPVAPPEPAALPPLPAAGGIQIVDLQISIASTGAAGTHGRASDAPLPRVEIGGSCPAGPLRGATTGLADRLQRCLACGDLSGLTGTHSLWLTWQHDSATPSAIEITEASAWHGHLRFCALAAVREVRLEADLDEVCTTSLSLEFVFPEPPPDQDGD